MENHIAAIIEDVINGKNEIIGANIERALKEGLAPETIMNKGLIAAMTEVGERFERGDYYVPEMLVAARSMETGLSILKPLLVSSDVKATGIAIIGTVLGDLHDIGKNLVAMMLRGAGFEVVDLGTSVSPEMFLDATKNHAPDLIAMSALLTTTMINMKATVEIFSQEGIRDEVKIIIGGAPVTADYSQQIGADGFAPDAHAAVVLAKQLTA